MRHYLDLSTVWAAVYPVAESGPAHAYLRQHEPPYLISWQHVLEVNWLLDGLMARGTKRQAQLHQARLNFNRYLAEGVFQPEPLAHWNEALQLATRWQRLPHLRPVPLSALSHPALASLNGFEAFVSVNPTARRFARLAGLELLPVRLD